MTKPQQNVAHADVLQLAVITGVAGHKVEMVQGNHNMTAVITGVAGHNSEVEMVQGNHNMTAVISGVAGHNSKVEMVQGNHNMMWSALMFGRLRQQCRGGITKLKQQSHNIP